MGFKVSKRRRVFIAILLAIGLLVTGIVSRLLGMDSTRSSTSVPITKTESTLTPQQTVTSSDLPRESANEVSPNPTPSAFLGNRQALALLETLPVKGRAPKTGYERSQFGQRWRDTDRNGCDTRNDILNRDLQDTSWKPRTRNCVVISGILPDPYSGKEIIFEKQNASKVQIDHVVALSNAWQTGAQQLPLDTREAFANDPLNLLAVNGALNQQKSDGDAATWLPPNKAFRCQYVSRQIAVKKKYGLWVTAAERRAMTSVLSNCQTRKLP